MLSASDLDDLGQGFPNQILESFKILIGQNFLGNQFRSHSHTGDTGIEPSFEILLIGAHAPSGHDTRPGLWPLDSFYKTGSIRGAREQFDHLTTEFLRPVDLRQRATAR